MKQICGEKISCEEKSSVMTKKVFLTIVFLKGGDQEKIRGNKTCDKKICEEEKNYNTNYKSLFLIMTPSAFTLEI